MEDNNTRPTGEDTQTTEGRIIGERHLGPEMVLGHKPGFITVGIYDQGGRLLGTLPYIALRDMPIVRESLTRWGKAQVWADSRLEAMCVSAMTVEA